MPTKKPVTDAVAAAEAPEATPPAAEAAPAKPARRRATPKPAEASAAAPPAESAEAPVTAPARKARAKAAAPAAAGVDAEAPAKKPRAARAAKAAPAAEAEAAASPDGAAPAKRAAKKPATAAKPVAKARAKAAEAVAPEPVSVVAAVAATTAEPATEPRPAAAPETPAAAAPAVAPAEAVAAAAAPVAVATAEASPATAPAAAAPAPESAKPEAVRRGRPRTPLEDVVVGTALRGKVVGLRQFGVFVDIGAMTDGLVHITEFPKKGVRKVEDVVKNGDTVDVWVKDVDPGANRISLTMRQPARHAIGSLSAGDVLSGTVTSLTPYGAFIDIGSDTEGLVHVSEMSSGYVKKPDDIVHSGDVVEVRIKEIDRNRQRISLSMVGLANDTGLAAAQEESARAKAEAEARAREAADSAYTPEEPAERQPTVVELALRRALGQVDDDGAPATRSTPQKSGRKASNRDLGDVYSRMIAEYRTSKSSEK